ncbi:acetyl esterase/lipase [Actinoplanes lutulentus]|uniref:Acetyl esterase/lipase n=1 Tax=Actinoplanes lutulentus TaxID=1287878 RepID=A0A327YVX7_9ACTN|nr:alpha/beta hydrolase [Actinoplanes lutulentus]MBB2940545.1 acetyl esterase/lipase [Actinoplanes lutulentus]RAK24815.1 acetyl esterase/lipase [Actinoplanes lutulentus]
MTDTPARPPYDPELARVLEAFAPPTVTTDMVPAARAAIAAQSTIEQALGDRPITHRSMVIPGYQGAEMKISVLKRHDHSAAEPGVYFVHGGGMVAGNRFTDLGQLADFVEEFGVVGVSVEYRLAPEFPDPYPVEDAYAGLVWTAANAGQLGIDPGRIVITGASAGAGIAAGTALLARDRQGPALLGQMLFYPMLDDRDATVSTHQYDGVGVWDRGSNVTGWTALLGERRGTGDVSIYAAPARAKDLTGLPSTYLDCGSAEVFRDEDVAYASALWAAGVQAELHVWPGGFHTFDTMAPDAALTSRLLAARSDWLRRLLGLA